MRRFNEQFARVPKSAHVAHRPLRPDENLASVFTWQETRQLTRNLVLHDKNKRYIIEDTPQSRAACGKRCLVSEDVTGHVRIAHNGSALAYRVFDKSPRASSRPRW